MFLVGLDIVGDKLMEINVFSPGGLGSAQRFEKVRFTQASSTPCSEKSTMSGITRGTLTTSTWPHCKAIRGAHSSL